LSITHHTRKRPSTGPQTTHGPQSPPWWVHWQHPHEVTQEKRKKETNKKKPQQAIESQRKAKSKITWRRQVSDPLGKGNASTHPRQKPCSNKERKPPNQSSNTTKSSPCTYASSPWAKAHSPWTNAAMQHGNATRRKNCSLYPGRLDRLHQAVRSSYHTSDRLVAVRPPQETGPAPNCSKFAWTNWNTFQTLPGAQKHAQTSPPCWQCMNQGKMRKVSTYSFSNIQSSSQGATQVQMSKLDTLQVRSDLNYVITKFHNHWTRLKRIWVILRKVTLS
jgi:hypothetical protein